jgi:hypothetical protein
MDINAKFNWQRQPKAEAFELTLLQQCCAGNTFIQELQHSMLKQTSTRLFDWVDHFVIGNLPGREKELEECGFVELDTTPAYRLFHHPGAQLPRIAVRDDSAPDIGVAIAVEKIADFLMVRGLDRWIEGEPYSGYRRSAITTAHGFTLWAIERRGVESIEPTYPPVTQIVAYLQAIEKWKSRPRQFEDEEGSLKYALDLAGELVSLLGRDLAACAVLECERDYWQSRNTAAQLQKYRQDRLGLGWANHDHHTFRSSRRNFAKLVRIFEILGFHCRERFWAGEEAGWGAQVMENPVCKLVLFLDVDLTADEIAIDFAHHPLPESHHLGTIGLWCELHGDSILQSGMHHLEAQFMFEELKQDLATVGVGMMQPFSNFPYLMQAFTAGEIWPVDQRRVEKLFKSQQIGKEQADKFSSQGAIGSHMENLQRREGYKGFNQKNVSIIIKQTDPRAH